MKKTTDTSWTEFTATTTAGTWMFTANGLTPGDTWEVYATFYWKLNGVWQHTSPTETRSVTISN